MRKATLKLAALAACALLAACGVRGNLDAPKGAPRQPTDQQVTLDKLI